MSTLDLSKVEPDGLFDSILHESRVDLGWPESPDRVELGDRPFLRPHGEQLLQRVLGAMAPGGTVRFVARNSAHWRNIADTLAGDVPTPPDWMRSVQATTKLMMDMGTLPQLLTPVQEECDLPKRWGRLVPILAESAGVPTDYMTFQMSTPYFGYECTKLRAIPDECTYPGMTFIVGTSGDDRKFALNAKICPAFTNPRNQVITRGNNTSPKELFALAYEKAEHDIIVYTHQDVYLPNGWDRRFHAAFQAAEAGGRRIGVAGVFGVSGNRSTTGRIEAGLVVDTYGARTLRGTETLPAHVRTLDGICLAFHRDVRFDIVGEMGFHFYDADICLQAAHRGLAVVALEAPFFHSSSYGGPTIGFMESENVFRRLRAADLPMEVPCELVTPEK